MKCPSCNAEIGSSKFCEYCGSQITVEMQKEQEQLNKEGCPKCGSTNIEIKRENQGEVRGKNSKKVLHQTVGFCKDCGYTWYPNGKEKPRKTWAWVLGWIFIFPLPLTLILMKKKDMKPALKYGIIAAAWILYFIIAIASKSSKTDEPVVPEQTTVTIEAETEEAEESEEKTELPSIKESKENPIISKVDEIKDNVSSEYRNALKSAESYSKTMHMSKQAIYDQLTSEYGGQFPDEAAKYAVDNLNVDFKENALKSAESYSKTMHMSKQGIYDQLTSEYGGKFTADEAKYAVDNLNVDFKENALKSAQSYSETMHMSKQGIYDQLISEYGGKFTADEAQYAIDHLE